MAGSQSLRFSLQVRTLGHEARGELSTMTSATA
jgi:hypothetical protein